MPLGETDVVPCPACNAQVPVPDKLRELRRAEREERSDRAEAEKLYRTLGKPPSWLLRAWVTGFVLGASAVVSVLAAIVAIGGVFLIFLAVGLELVLHGLAGPFGVDLVDRYGGGWAYAGVAGAMLLFGVVPVRLASYLQESGALRLELLGNLAAKPPERPGFPSTCRECGAALEVPPGAYGVRCAYCRSDNLVRLPAAWLARVGTHEKHFHGSMVDASNKARELREQGRSKLTSTAIIGAIIIAVMGVVGYIATRIDEDYPVDFATSLGPPRVLVHWVDHSTLAENVQGDAYTETWIARRHREVLEIVVHGACPTLKMFNTTTFPLLQNDDAIAFGVAADGTRVARYRAPYTGIFKPQLKGAATMRWRIERGLPPPLAPLTGCE